MKHYKPLEVTHLATKGISIALDAMRLPKPQTQHTSHADDLELAAKLIKTGDDHAKAMRGIIVWYELKCQLGWLIEYEQYEIGITRLSSSSAMHGELKTLTGVELAERKQADLPDKVYTIVDCASYQALRRIYIARKGHRHPDWQIFRRWIEGLGYFDKLIYPEGVEVDR